MIKYIVDNENKYDEDILFHLRKHNYSMTDDYTKKSYNLYCVDNDKLIGAMTARIGWNWVSPKSMFYENTNVLDSMINSLITVSKEYAEGIKTIEEVKERFEDFLKIGFENKNIVKVTDSETWYYADQINFNKNLSSKYDVLISDVEVEEYNEILLNKSKEFDELNNVSKVLEEYNIVALDNDTFCGGAGIEVYKDHIYTHLLAVNEEYKGNGIGSKLMKMIEDIARKNNHKYLSVGTTEFQARPFYEKMGYKVIHTRQDNPKGFESYTLINKL